MKEKPTRNEKRRAAKSVLLHNAAWAGSGDLVELMITRGHPVDIRDPGHDATPLAWALYDCLVEKRHPEVEFARVVKALLEAEVR